MMERLRRTRGEPVVKLGVDGIDEIKLAAAQAQDFDIAIRLNIEPDGVEIRKRAALRVLLPVVRIALELHARSGFVFGNHEWPEDCRFVMRMRRHDRDLVEEAIEADDGR